MARIEFMVDGTARQGYLALPQGGRGRGILVLHAWWGLTGFFELPCDRLAAEGYVAFAPDIHHGKTTAKIEEAMQILETRDFAAAQATAEGGLQYLQQHPAVLGDKVGALGFSMGAHFALLLDSLHPDAFAGLVLFYGPSTFDTSQSKARFLYHFAEEDKEEPIEDVRRMPVANGVVHIYPNAGHWFFESNRPQDYKPEAAALAWDRTIEFFKTTLE